MKNVAWVDVHHRKYKMKDISDSYLRNILNFIYRGGGYNQFLTEDKVIDLYTEAKERDIKLRFDLRKLLRARF